MQHLKEARPDHPIEELVAQRWSPYVSSHRPVATEDLLALFKAARWAASSHNEQPWRYLVATRGNASAFERLLEC